MLRFAAAAAAVLAALFVAASSPEAQAATLTVQTTTPANGATVQGTILWDVTVSGGTPDRVEYSIDGTLKWTERAAPYRYNGDTGSLDTRTLADGGHTLVARAFATTGETFTATTTITVANNTSGFGITNVSPTNGATLSGSIRWEARMTAGTASQIDFFIDGVQKWTEHGAPYVYNGDTGSLDTRTLGNGTHTLMARATGASGQTASSEVSVNVSNVTSTLNRTIYCLGSPTYGTGGFAYDGTQFGWIRQYPKNMPGRVAFDNSFSLMKGVGCDTAKAEIQANDPDANGGTDAQRAQLYSSDALVAKYGGLPSFGATRGTKRWYSFAFATNGGYRPQNSTAYPNWNYIFGWHNSGPSGPPNLIIEVATATQPGCGGAFTKLATPRLEVELNGGDTSKFPYNGATCRRFFGPDFVAGQRYTVEMGVTWADNNTGSLEVWINGQQVANISSVSTLWLNQSVYPIFENYRPGKVQIGGLITWTNTVYYAGMLMGPTRNDVALPSS